MAPQMERAVSSVGRAFRLHRKGQRFETVTAHHLKSIDLVLLNYNYSSRKLVSQIHPEIFVLNVKI